MRPEIFRLGYIFLLLLGGVLLISPFTIPLLFSASLALSLQPVFSFFHSKSGRRHLWAILITGLFGIIISIPLFFFLIRGGIILTSRLEKLTSSGALKLGGLQDVVSGYYLELFLSLEKFLTRFHLDFLTREKIEGYLTQVSLWVLKFFRDLILDVPGLILFFFVMMMGTYAFLFYGDKIKIFFQNLFGFSDEKMTRLVHVLILSCRQVYLSNILTGAIQSFLVAAGIALLGKGEFFLLFFVTLILSFIPVVGAAPVAFLFCLISFFQGDRTGGIILLVLGIFSGLVDNILRPWLASLGETKISPVVSFICVLGGVLWLGFPGLLVGLLMGPLMFETIPLFWEKK